MVPLMPNKNQHVIGAYYSPETVLSGMQRCIQCGPSQCETHHLVGDMGT